MTSQPPTYILGGWYGVPPKRKSSSSLVSLGTCCWTCSDTCLLFTEGTKLQSNESWVKADKSFPSVYGLNSANTSQEAAQPLLLPHTELADCQGPSILLSRGDPPYISVQGVSPLHIHGVHLSLLNFMSSLSTLSCSLARSLCAVALSPCVQTACHLKTSQCTLPHPPGHQ